MNSIIQDLKKLPLEIEYIIYDYIKPVEEFKEVYWELDDIFENWVHSVCGGWDTSDLDEEEEKDYPFIDWFFRLNSFSR